MSEFARQLGEKIKRMDFISFNNGVTIGYAGSLDGINPKDMGVYKIVSVISEYSENTYC